ncbi:protein of unknown function DUF1634 [Paludibacter propionicigenes WB4]|uniref:DUF1634 domain-containing protein n=1 Tax=Paludibacter propionicigenes (strain DSM 17365 / JCM 13257 / WB4) TaxID=694427 RepID=E4T0S5_PALPW|nr:DUF1634 domain-containing protein [Paludibacter propionicigenes]ADQ78200.1 protein of unknown function DUF1634 [Paludibacter propionicigenes WB4]
MNKLTSQHDIDLIIGKLLRAGVLTASAITVFGGILYLIQHHGSTANYGVVASNEIFRGAPAYLRELSSILPQIIRFDGAAIVQFGLIVLIATPVLRVVFSLISFAIEKDKLYVGITTLVLIIIMINMFFGLH